MLTCKVNYLPHKSPLTLSFWSSIRPDLLCCQLTTPHLSMQDAMASRKAELRAIKGLNAAEPAIAPLQGPSWQRSAILPASRYGSSLVRRQPTRYRACPAASGRLLKNSKEAYQLLYLHGVLFSIVAFIDTSFTHIKGAFRVQLLLTGNGFVISTCFSGKILTVAL